MVLREQISFEIFHCLDSGKLVILMVSGEFFIFFPSNTNLSFLGVVNIFFIPDFYKLPMQVLLQES